jgi:hypothetical protein
VKRSSIRSLRIAAGVGALAIVSAACGGGEPVAISTFQAKPAAFIVSPGKVKALVPTPTAVPTARPSAAVVAPTGFARPERVQGPPGNPAPPQNLSSPPPPGRYPYRVIAEGSFGQQEAEFEVELREPKQVPGAQSQLEIWHIPGFEQELTHHWGSDSLLLAKIKSKQFDGTTVECELKPPAIVIQLPLSEGATWSSESSCNGETASENVRVLRTEQVDVGGTTVDTFVIRSVSKSGGTTTTATRWYAPAERLTVIFEQDTDDPEFGESKVTVEALGLSPATG